MKRPTRWCSLTLDSLVQDHAADEEAYTLVLASPPFAGSLDYENTAKDLLQIVKTRKTELLFVALFLKLLKPGGRAAVSVPDGVLFGSSKAHKELRRLLIVLQLVADGVLRQPMLYPSLFFKTHRALYYELLNEVRLAATWSAGSTSSPRACRSAQCRRWPRPTRCWRSSMPTATALPA